MSEQKSWSNRKHAGPNDFQVGGEPAQGEPLRCPHGKVANRGCTECGPVEGISAEQFRKQNSRPNMTMADLMEAYADLKTRERAMKAATAIYYQRGLSAEWSIESLAKIIEGK